MIWCAKDREARYRFNYEAMKSLNDDLQMRSDWLLPICNGGERLKDRDGRKAHPTQKPEALLHRVILASTQPGDLVLDPFFGTGTTGVVAKRLGRNYIGIERDKGYIAVAEKRLGATPANTDIDIVAIPAKRDEPRIPFGWLVERGYLSPGTLLTSANRRWTAKVRADGTLISADCRGSIHQVGAHVQGAPACNGWEFWYLEVEGKLVPIDLLRQKLRAELH
jgi:modification methylase